MREQAVPSYTVTSDLRFSWIQRTNSHSSLMYASCQRRDYYQYVRPVVFHSASKEHTAQEQKGAERWWMGGADQRAVSSRRRSRLPPRPIRWITQKWPVRTSRSRRGCKSIRPLFFGNVPKYQNSGTACSKGSCAARYFLGWPPFFSRMQRNLCLVPRFPGFDTVSFEYRFWYPYYNLWRRVLQPVAKPWVLNRPKPPPPRRSFLQRGGANKEEMK